MRMLLLAILLTIFPGCFNKSQNYNERRELVPDPEGYQKDTFAVPADSLYMKDTLAKEPVL
ncbi:hypothetical protein [Chitinophaga sp.]|uniref:hypothetical protein n=1 Tax=Chitinophaga sp. TaxID=1869181 RepID=UPI002CB0C798|nr:hypothetical protein [Chitinophaga sp.]HWV67473.1 hypothetical protein [Chitinophaga sp.]